MAKQVFSPETPKQNITAYCEVSI